MAMEIQGRVGPLQASDGAVQDPRLGRTTEMVVTDAHGRYYEQTSRGGLFHATTATAGIAHGSALTATGALMLANPLGSGRNLSILRLVMGYVSGTLGVGSLWWTVGINPAALPAETAAAIRNCGLLNGSSNSDVARAYSGVSLTTVPAIVRPSAIAYNPYAGAAAPLTVNSPLTEEVAGELVVPPGFFVAVEGIGTAGTTPLIVLGISYEVVPQ